MIHIAVGGTWRPAAGMSMAYSQQILHISNCRLTLWEGYWASITNNNIRKHFQVQLTSSSIWHVTIQLIHDLFWFTICVSRFNITTVFIRRFLSTVTSHVYPLLYIIVLSAVYITQYSWKKVGMNHSSSMHNTLLQFQLLLHP